MQINNLKRREFFKVLGAGAATAAAVSLPVGATSSHAAPIDFRTPEQPLDGTAMAELVRSKKVTPKELVQEAIYKINKTNQQVNAVVSECFDLALERADSINPNSPFAGVPLLAKDCVDVEGLDCTLGSLLNQGRRPTETSWFIRAAHNAGLNTIGMSNIPEMMTLGCTQNPLYGATRNPWDLAKGVHSSTGGGAAAVAAGYTPIIHSTDGGGSSRMPASATGIFGYKPSRDQLITGLSNGSTQEDFTHQSFMSRSVRDTALAISVTENHIKDGFDTPFARTALGMVHRPLNRQIRVGVTMRDIHGRLPDTPTQLAIKSTVELLQQLGHIVVEVDQPVNNAEQFMFSYMGVFGNKMAQFASQFDALGKPLESMPELVSDNVTYLARTMQLRVEKNPNLYQQSQQECHQFALKHNHEFFKNIDVWLTPCTHHVPKDISYFDQKQHSGEEIWLRSERLMSYTPIENVAGNPAMSVPLYWSKDNMPVGSHFSAARGNDRLLFELAYQLEAARPWADKKAPIYL
ncbi:amidase [Vibrio ponticus]|uniref:Amidase n=1 Tax=Vibrio ponticus TaxID=265668 RepID=A0A3N3DU48_9VIBR|nr:amidase family protein [Vibrio ponticus]ROV57728.1 amidase [Vibrio ponticus]